MTYKILKIQLFILFIAVSNNLFCQITVKWQLDLDFKQAKIEIYNHSNKKIVLPLDTTSFQAYFKDNYVMSRSEWNKDYPFYSFTINTYDALTNKRMETHSSTPYLDLSDFEKQRSNTESANKDYSSKIDSWKKNNNLKSDLNAEINYYLLRNLMFLQPKETKIFYVPYNLKNITNKDNTIHDSYVLEENKNYTLFLSLQVKNDIYNYLTPHQKQKLKKYKLFTGSLESNKIEIKR